MQWPRAGHAMAAQWPNNGHELTTRWPCYGRESYVNGSALRLLVVETLTDNNWQRADVDFQTQLDYNAL